MVRLQQGQTSAVIDSGELVSFQVQGHELIHQKGSPGWRNSDTEMFPIIGPTAAAGFSVTTPKGKAPQDQHGLLREMDYTLKEQTERQAIFQKEYLANTSIPNSKYPEKSTLEKVSWPYDFTFSKAFDLTDNGLSVTFTVSGENDMPYMLGYHPAFKLQNANAYIEAGTTRVSLQEVMEAGAKALPILDCDTLVLHDQKSVKIETHGFGAFMLWTEVPNMICIEPISFYPYAVENNELHKGFQELGPSEESFEVKISVLA
ncbi:aldose 1-epimerase [Sediminicola luteus]|uniref:Aldose epimerase n=1 Tax=Sediminicola luteus TaxID=319238 RepID=A0A2A4G675_9FLAO|nr:aldose 1-epimerase [Sediminicola luteus]PCE64469.1 aldose epimerase [Sediminicola luteus]